MKEATSLYLDVLRFTAAMLVFLSHVSGQLFTGGFLWQAGNYGQTAVVIFFVLSGYVIAHVLATREREPQIFAASRLGRLYSVVVPALILTALCDVIGLRAEPDFYYKGPWGYPEGDQTLRYVATAVFLNNSWLVPHMEPGINAPFWSLSNEAFYYAAIGLLVFGRGVFRWLSIGALIVIAGPTVVSLLPLWFLGFGAYYLARGYQGRLGLSVAIWTLSGLVLLASPFLPDYTDLMFVLGDRKTLPADYVGGLAFAAGLVAFEGFAHKVGPSLATADSVIRWLGSMTFALYLFHRPLIQVFAVYDIGDVSSLEQRLWVIGGPLLVVATLGSAAERTKGAYKQFFLRCFRAFSRQPAA